MRVGVIGLGKLGLPVACAIASRGVEVYGYDVRVEAMRIPDELSYEEGLAETVKQAEGNLHFVTLEQLVSAADVIFVAAQTPHELRFEGVTPLPEDRADFDYSHLKVAVARIADAAYRQKHRVTVAVISTVLPGTMAREVAPLLGGYASLVYNPSFIAMGTTIRDFLDPEFVLLGGDDDGKVDAVYRRIYGLDGPRRVRTSVPNAELIKVAYNTFIGLKIAFANTLMEVCHKTDCDVDEVTGALKLAHRRLISPAYLDGGMGDGGGCHPRDNIALSWLARELDLSHDLFEDAMVCREDQANWLLGVAGKYQMAEFRPRWQADHDAEMLPPGILGVAYKPGSHITTGSPALLMANISERRNYPVALFDPHVEGIPDYPDEPHALIIGCKHPEFSTYKFPAGSVVIDPFRYISDQPGVEVIRIGEGLDPPAHHRTAADGAAVRTRAA
jgi:UDPglucose 6-dehydrogenase